MTVYLESEVQKRIGSPGKIRTYNPSVNREESARGKLLTVKRKSRGACRLAIMDPIPELGHAGWGPVSMLMNGSSG